MKIVKKAFLTGIDDSAIARAICSSLLQSGYEVVAATEGKYGPDMEDRIQFDIDHQEFEPVVFEAVDYCSEESVTMLLSRLSSRKYDVVVNCAATLATLPEGKLRNESIQFDYSEFGRVLQYNVTAVAAICFGLIKSMKPGSVIVNVTSAAAQEGAFATISYNASKAAIDNLTKSLANVFGPKGIRVNSIAPGWIPPSGDVAAEGVVALANAMTPSVNAGEPANVVSAMHYLIENKFQNGAILMVDGGITSSYLPYMLESLQLQDKPVEEIIDTLTEMIQSSKEEMGS